MNADHISLYGRTIPIIIYAQIFNQHSVAFRQKIGRKMCVLFIRLAAIKRDVPYFRCGIPVIYHYFPGEVAEQATLYPLLACLLKIVTFVFYHRMCPQKTWSPIYLARYRAKWSWSVVIGAVVDVVVRVHLRDNLQKGHILWLRINIIIRYVWCTPQQKLGVIWKCGVLHITIGLTAHELSLKLVICLTEHNRHIVCLFIHQIYN